MSKPKTKTNSLQKCGTSHKRSHILVTCVIDGLSRVTLTCCQSLCGPTECRESPRLMRIDPLLVALSSHINHHHWFFLIEFTAGVCVCLFVCLYSSTVKTSSDCKMSKTYLRGTDQRSCVVNIHLGASAKFLHLYFRIYLISPPKT